MGTERWQRALESALAEPGPCFMCAETLWTRCHRRLIAELLHARGHEVVHRLGPGRVEPHVPWAIAAARAGRPSLRGEPAAWTCAGEDLNLPGLCRHLALTPT